MISPEEFIVILRNCYKFLSISRVRAKILLVIFAKIDKNNDGFITFDEFLDWIKRYIAVEINRGDEWYTKEDDASIGS